MQNPFKHPFEVTNNYIDLSLRGLGKKIICIHFNGVESTGHGILLLAARNNFSGPDEALVILMQRLLFLIEEWENYKIFSRKDIQDFTQHFLVPQYNKNNLVTFDVKEFVGEYKERLFQFREFEKNNIPHHVDKTFGMKLDNGVTTDFTGFDPLAYEEVIESFYFKNENNEKEYFAVTKENYIYFNWWRSW